jgi:sugar/nucleoside kinase (ribokinase family)
MAFMTSKPLHLTGIGYAIVDVIALTDDAFLREHGLAKGAMTLVDEARSQAIYAKMGVATEQSGGSVANSMAMVAALGGKAGFIGKLFDDQLGRAFRHDMQAMGIDFKTPATSLGKSTAVCLILVTPDAQRTMATFIGASAFVSPNDVDEKLIAASQMLYLEGYLWDEPETKAALRKAAIFAREHDTKVAFTLSDGFCVARHREEFITLIREQVDVLFANEAEALALTQTVDVTAAKNILRDWAEVVAITRGAQGSLLLRGAEEVIVPAVIEGAIIDTTGAGDAYAAGVLYGLTHGFGLAEAGALGSRLAGHIITQMGARSQKPLMHLLGQSRAA